MNIGVPKEIMPNENRVAVTPASVVSLLNAGHNIYIETNAGVGSGFEDHLYEEVGAVIVKTAAEAWSQKMVMKVKEPLNQEYDYLHEDLILFTYLHLANEKGLTETLLNKKVTGIAYETVQLDNGTLPLLTPMSEVAGRMAAQIGAQFLEKSKGGKGVLLAGIPGVQRVKVTVIGGGVVGMNAAKILVGLGADVTLLDLSPDRLRHLDDVFGSSLNTLMSNPMNIAESVAQSDLVIGAVLIPGSKAPKLVTEEMVKNMTEGSVIVDVAIDQGGIFETSDHVTTHKDPVYVKHGVLHYSVPNMPGGVPKTSTIGLSNVTTPFALQIANKGYQNACLDNPALLKGLNTVQGHITNQGVATSLNKDYTDAKSLLK